MKKTIFFLIYTCGFSCAATISVQHATITVVINFFINRFVFK